MLDRITRRPLAVLARQVGPRRLWVILVAWSIGWSLLAARGGGYSWHYFAEVAHLLINPGVNGGGLHLYAAHPDLQIGPIALLVAAPLNALGPTGGTLGAELTLALLGPLLLYVLVVARRRPYLGAGRLAGAIDSKPWAAGFVVLIVALPSAKRWRAALLTALGVAGAWLPLCPGRPDDARPEPFH